MATCVMTAGRHLPRLNQMKAVPKSWVWAPLAVTYSPGVKAALKASTCLLRDCNSTAGMEVGAGMGGVGWGKSDRGVIF